MVETSDEWIYSRVGIRERHLVERGMATSDMTVEAAKRYLDSRGILATIGTPCARASGAVFNPACVIQSTARLRSSICGSAYDDCVHGIGPRLSGSMFLQIDRTTWASGSFSTASRMIL